MKKLLLILLFLSILSSCGESGCISGDCENGYGAYLNNPRLRVSSRSKLKECIVFTGGPKINSKNKEQSMKEYEKFSSTVMIPIRKLGSAALDIAYVAAGRCDGYWQRNLKYWDIAAGIILVKEAGGLAILGTERHDSRRIDRQLRGRSGRQGDPGSSLFYVSLTFFFSFLCQILWRPARRQGRLNQIIHHISY